MSSSKSTETPTGVNVTSAGLRTDRFGTQVQSLQFCSCDQDWADPECATERKSQATAFAISIFGGFLGLDQFYLGFIYPYGVFKLATLGGLGVWWLYDMVRIGSSPVYTVDSFQVANNVPHWVFVLSMLSFIGALGFVFSAWSIQRHRVRKAREVMLLQAEGPSMGSADARSFSGYGSTLQSRKVLV